MNTTQPPFDNPKVRQAVNYAINPRQVERISPAKSCRRSRSSRRYAGLREFDLYPTHGQSQTLIKEAIPRT